MNSRFALGTAQFGMDYGINNQRGKIPLEEASKILEYAVSHGVDTVDSAYSYGDSEKVIGEFIKSEGSAFNIISKLGGNKDLDIEKTVDESLRRLNLDNIYGYLIHDFKFFMANPSIWDDLCHLKDKGKIKKIGFSVYFPQEIQTLWQKGIQMDLVQVPFSIFDQRFLSMFPLLREKRTEIHTRSIFLQGLVFKNVNDLKDRFLGIKEKLLVLSSLAEQIKVPLAGLCINFALLNQYIDKIILGVDSLDNLKENLNMVVFQEKVRSINSQLFGLAENNEDIILPFNWR
jgi:aryl-alcohol dehydrogenase-like predicted oxidoreductase